MKDIIPTFLVIDNFQVIVQDHFQHRFHVKWTEIVDGRLIGSDILSNWMNDLQFLYNDLPVRLEDVPLNVRGRIWFLHNGVLFSNPTKHKDTLYR